MIKQEVLHFLKTNEKVYNKDGELNSNLNKYLKNRYPSVLEDIKNLTSFLKQEAKLPERVYCLLNSIKEPVKCRWCEKKDVKFYSYVKGYIDYCGHSCVGQSTAKRREEGDLQKHIISKQGKKVISKGVSLAKAGKTYEDIFGKEKALAIKEKLSIPSPKKGKTFEKMYGKEKALELKENKRIELIEFYNKQGSCTPFFNLYSCEFFDYFDKTNNIIGQYATKGKERRTTTGYFLDYINDDLKLIVEWDEDYHNNKRQKEKDVERQNNIVNSDEFKNYIFLRIKENKDLSFDKVSTNLLEEYNYYNNMT